MTLRQFVDLTDKDVVYNKNHPEKLFEVTSWIGDAETAFREIEDNVEMDQRQYRCLYLINTKQLNGPLEYDQIQEDNYEDWELITSTSETPLETRFQHLLYQHIALQSFV